MADNNRHIDPNPYSITPCIQQTTRFLFQLLKWAAHTNLWGSNVESKPQIHTLDTFGICLLDCWVLKKTPQFTSTVKLYSVGRFRELSSYNCLVE